LFESKYQVFFAKIFFFISVSGSFLLSYFANVYFNSNWLGITVVLSSVIMMLSLRKEHNFSFILIFFAVAFYSFLALSSRGASIAAFFSGLYLISLPIVWRRFQEKVNAFVIICFVISSIAISIIGVMLYNSRIYPYLMALSIEHSGKNLDSSRLERWDLGASLFLERPVIGWGIDASVVRVADIEGGGDLHNFWWEVLFRSGVVGALTFFSIFSYVAYKQVKSRPRGSDVVSFSVIFIFMSVYSLGGVTHWPGSFMFWLVIGILLKRAIVRIASSNLAHFPL
jgi:O-antigen ligase